MLVFIGTPQISSCLKGTSFRKLPHFLTPHGSDACGPPVADEKQHPVETGIPDRVFGSKSRTARVNFRKRQTGSPAGTPHFAGWPLLPPLFPKPSCSIPQPPCTPGSWVLCPGECWGFTQAFSKFSDSPLGLKTAAFLGSAQDPSPAQPPQLLTSLQPSPPPSLARL